MMESCSDVMLPHIIASFDSCNLALPFFFTGLQQPSDTAFRIEITFSECHVILQPSTMLPGKPKQKSMKMTNVIVGLLIFIIGQHTQVRAASGWIEVALTVIPFYSSEWLLSANYCSQCDFPDLYFGRIFLPSHFSYYSWNH